MGVFSGPEIRSNDLVLALDAGNTQSYVGSGVTWTDLTNKLNPLPNTGYFGGGQSPAYNSTMDKVTYSTDTTAQIPGAALSFARSNLAATGSSTAGYFGGGFPGPRSTMDKVTYSSDTTVAVPGAFLTVSRYNVAATGSSSAGYFGGGFFPATPNQYYSTMDKVTYSSDTTAAVPGAALSSVRAQLAATGNSTAGYFGGGAIPTSTSIMDKLTYSTDTTAALPSSANLSAPRVQSAATGNSTSGYFGGGSPGPTSTMDKITYATDTRSTVPGAALSAARSSLAATGSSTAGYFGGGSVPALHSTMDKVTYSTDTTAAVPGASLSLARTGLAASSARANALPENASNSATLDNGVGYSNTSGGSLTFDGVNDVANSALAKIPVSTQITISAWVIHNTLPSSVQRYVTIGNDIAVIRHDGATSVGQLHFYITTSGTLKLNLRVNNSLVTNTWYHVVGTWDGTTSRLYKNGVEIGTDTPGGTLDGGNLSYNISSSAESLDGNISQVLVYNRALSASEVQQNFNALRGRYGI